jgi:hypothetical protein
MVTTVDKLSKGVHYLEEDNVHCVLGDCSEDIAVDKKILSQKDHAYIQGV